MRGRELWDANTIMKLSGDLHIQQSVLAVNFPGLQNCCRVKMVITPVIEENKIKTKGVSTDIASRLVVAKGERAGGGTEWESGISRCKLVYIGWINNKVLL